MSKSEKITDGAEAVPQPATKKRKKKLLMMIAVGLMAAAGAGGYLLLGAGGSSGEPPTPEAGDVLALDAVTINLTDGHYLKIRLALQATAEVAHEPEGSKALDLAIEQFSGYAMGDLSSSEGRQKAKDELREHLKEAYHGDVMDVYFTEFVMQ